MKLFRTLLPYILLVLFIAPGVSVRAAASLGTPTAMAAEVSGTSVKLSWKDNAQGESMYNVWRRIADKPGSEWRLVATPPANSESYTEQNVPMGTYEYDVNACAGTVCSEYSNYARATVRAAVAGVSTGVVSYTGTVRTAAGDPVVDALVWINGRSTDGAASVRTLADGSFAVELPMNTTWGLGAKKDLGGYAYRSEEVIVDTTLGPRLILITLPKTGTLLPQPVLVTGESTRTIAVKTQDGAQVIVPPGAVAAASAIHVHIEPTTEVSTDGTVRPVSTAYDITLKDPTGREYTQTQGEVEIVLPYRDDDLQRMGISARTLKPSYFDEDTGKWVQIDSYELDTVNKQIKLKVKHFTRFCIVAPGEGQAINLPSNIAAETMPGGHVVLTWTNPAQDFHHVIVYRSEAADKVGSVIAGSVFDGTYTDTTAILGKTYYYSFVAVNPLGLQSDPTPALAVINDSGLELQNQAAHYNGTLINDNGTIYLIRGGKRLAFRDPNEYQSHGYKFSQAVPASSGDRQLPNDGGVMKALEGTLVLDASDNKTIYMIGTNNTKRGFASEAVFRGLGYTFGAVLKINVSDYTAGPPITSSEAPHPDGALVVSGQTVWWIRTGSRQGFQSLAVYNTYGFPLSRIVKANAADMNLLEGSPVKFRDGTLVQDGTVIYLISDGKKLPFASLAALTMRGYSVSNVIQANIATYEQGSPIQ